MKKNLKINSVEESFSSASKGYAKKAIIQAKIARKLSHIYCIHTHEKLGEKILCDIGCGTGFIADNLSKKLKNNLIQVDSSQAMCNLAKSKAKQTICADIENLPFEDDSIDHFISSMSLHWLDCFKTSVIKISKIQKKNGYFALALPLKGSFSYVKAVSSNKMINDFPNFSLITESFLKAGYLIKHYESEKLYQNFDNIFSLARHFHETGVSKRLEQDKNKSKFIKHLRNNSFENSWYIGYFIFEKR